MPTGADNDGGRGLCSFLVPSGGLTQLAGLYSLRALALPNYIVQKPADWRALAALPALQVGGSALQGGGSRTLRPKRYKRSQACWPRL